MDMLYGSNRMKEVFQEPSIVSFRRDKNLCDTLVHGKISAALKPTSIVCQKKVVRTVPCCREMWSGTCQTNSISNWTLPAAS